MSAFWLQCLTYEAAAPYGPRWSALAAGFAILIGHRLHLTRAGERYLAQFHPEPKEAD